MAFTRARSAKGRTGRFHFNWFIKSATQSLMYLSKARGRNALGKNAWGLSPFSTYGDEEL